MRTELKILNLNGTLNRVAEYASDLEIVEPQKMIDDAVEASREGYFAIIGENLEGDATTQAAKVVGASGVLVFQNVLDSTKPARNFRKKI